MRQLLRSTLGPSPLRVRTIIHMTFHENSPQLIWKSLYVHKFECEFRMNFARWCFYATRCCTLVFFSYSFFSCFVHIVETDGAIVLLRDFFYLSFCRLHFQTMWHWHGFIGTLSSYFHCSTREFVAFFERLCLAKENKQLQDALLKFY